MEFVAVVISERTTSKRTQIAARGDLVSGEEAKGLRGESPPGVSAGAKAALNLSAKLCASALVLPRPAPPAPPVPNVKGFPPGELKDEMEEEEEEAGEEGEEENEGATDTSEASMLSRSPCPPPSSPSSPSSSSNSSSPSFSWEGFEKSV